MMEMDCAYYWAVAQGGYDHRDSAAFDNIRAVNKKLAKVTKKFEYLNERGSLHEYILNAQQRYEYYFDTEQYFHIGDQLFSYLTPEQQAVFLKQSMRIIAQRLQLFNATCKQDDKPTSESLEMIKSLHCDLARFAEEGLCLFASLTQSLLELELETINKKVVNDCCVRLSSAAG